LTAAPGEPVDREAYLELFKDAIRKRQKQQKLALLLGVVPPLPSQRVRTWGQQ
jgi:hypothetical protein